MKTADLTPAQLDYWVGRAMEINEVPGVHQTVDGRFAWSPYSGELFVYEPTKNRNQAERAQRLFRIATPAENWQMELCRAIVRITYGDEVPDV